MNIKASSIITIVSGIIMAGITFIFTKVINVLIACKNFVGIAVLLIVVASYYKNDIIEIIKYNQAKTFEIENKKLSIQQEKDRLQQENELADKKLQQDKEIAEKKEQRERELADKKLQQAKDLAEKKLQQKKEIVDKQDAIYKKKATEYNDLGVTAGNNGNYKLQCSYWKISLGYFIKISENNWINQFDEPKADYIDNATKNTNDICNKATEQENWQMIHKKELDEKTNVKIFVDPKLSVYNDQFNVDGKGKDGILNALIVQSSIDGTYYYGTSITTLIDDVTRQCNLGIFLGMVGRTFNQITIPCDNNVIPNITIDHIKIRYDDHSDRYIIGLINDTTNLLHLILINPKGNRLQDLGNIEYDYTTQFKISVTQWDKDIPNIQVTNDKMSFDAVYSWNGSKYVFDKVI